MMRYLRLYTAFARISLQGEMAFRANYLIKTFVEVAWLCLMAFFYDRLFEYTSIVAGWSKSEYFFFLGTYFLMESMIETLFMSNVVEFSELVRSGNLDLMLLKPVDEQFLVTCKQVEFSTVPNGLFGLFLMSRSLTQIGTMPEWERIAAFAVTMICSVGIAYSFLLMLAATAVWMVRNQSLYELWWLFMSFVRYPREIFNAPWVYGIGWFFTFMIPVALAVNVPAESMVQVLDPRLVMYFVAATLFALWFSRWVFRRALRSYRSASS
jgi:ABC-2 type transport system permease protein